jgi:hypothetical protein
MVNQEDPEAGSKLMNNLNGRKLVWWELAERCRSKDLVVGGLKKGGKENGNWKKKEVTRQEQGGIPSVAWENQCW